MNSRYSKSLDAWARASSRLVPGSATISKHPKLATFGAYPIYARSAVGANLIDIDGNSYLDFGSALGAIILGYNFPDVVQTVRHQLELGVLYSLSSDLPIQLASLISDLVPSMEQLRLLKNGSDATSAAARIARAYTGRSKIAVCHYHGWHDWYYISTGMGAGIPDSFGSEVLSFRYNDINSVKELITKCGKDIAAFILEPAHLDSPEFNFLSNLKEIVHENGSLLIFDEVVTGFRFANGGAQTHFNVSPDLTCLAKAMGNGFPIAALGGREEIMKSTENVITSMTYGEEALSTAAAISTLTFLRDHPMSEHLWEIGADFKERFNALGEEYEIPIRCEGFPVRMDFMYSGSRLGERKLTKTYFLQETARRGVLFGSHLFVNYAHQKSDVDFAIGICEEVFAKISKLDVITPTLIDGLTTEELW